MTFAAPIWFLALVPWTAITFYLLWGRRRRIDVPFLALWPAIEGGIRVRRRATPPTVAILLAIISMLLAILAAGRPAIVWPFARDPISVIVDRGWTMSSSGANDAPKAASLYREPMASLGPLQPMNVWTTPATANEPVRTDASDFIAGPYPENCRPTAMITRDTLRAAVRARLADDPGIVIVFSNQQLDLDDRRLIQIAPGEPPLPQIASVSARETPSPQVMVSLRGPAGRLRVSSADASVERDVTPAPGAEHHEFVDLPRIGQTIKAEFIVNGVIAPTSVAWLVRESSWPRIEVRAALHPSLQRMVEIYTRQRPARENSHRVGVVANLDEPPSSEGGIVVPNNFPLAAASSVLQLADHPISRDVDWSEIGAPNVVDSLPPAGWTPIVSAGGRTWVAIRDRPTRAVWIGFDSSEWSRSTGFVVFWANVFNWAGAGGEQLTAHPIGSLEGKWTPMDLAPSAGQPDPLLWPGLYRREDGTFRALRAGEVGALSSSQTDWRERLNRLQNGRRGQVELGPIIALLSIVSLCGCAATWKTSKQSAVPQT